MRRSEKNVSEQKAAIERNGEATLLVVDDEPEIVALLDEYFTGLGYRVLTAEDGATALKRAEQSPDLIVLDEPTSALDPISTSKIEELAMQLKEQYTIVIVTHNMQQAVRISDRTAFFLLGELVECDDTQQLFSQPQDKRTEDYITGRFG